MNVTLFYFLNSPCTLIPTYCTVFHPPTSDLRQSSRTSGMLPLTCTTGAAIILATSEQYGVPRPRSGGVVNATWLFTIRWTLPPTSKCGILPRNSVSWLIPCPVMAPSPWTCGGQRSQYRSTELTDSFTWRVWNSMSTTTL
jgi:hypothetical protein